jgi:hypothetical protein
MEQQQQTDAPKPRRGPGRKAGARDSKPRVRRTRAQIAQARAETGTAVPLKRESDHQKQFIKWIDMQPAPGIPGGKLGHYCYAVPNGVWIPTPDKHLRMRIIMSQRRLGLRKGVPDIIIDLPLHQWHGCRLELKRDESSNVSDEQKAWLERLRARGYFCELVPGIQGATAAVRRYLEGEQPLPFPWEV